MDLSYSGIDSYGIKTLTLNISKLTHLKQLYIDSISYMIYYLLLFIIIIIDNPFSDTGLKYLVPFLHLIIDDEGLLDLSSII